MTEKTEKKPVEIDASGKSLGRLASEVAVILMGKDSPDYERNVVSGNKVRVLNSSQINISSKRAQEKTYTRYSGYPGGLKTETLDKVIKDKGIEEVLRRAVYGMLPSNKLRKPTMKNLEIRE